MMNRIIDSSKAAPLSRRPAPLLSWSASVVLTGARSSELKSAVGGGHPLLKIWQSLSFSSNIFQIKASSSEARCSLRAGHYVAIGRDYLAMTEEDSPPFSPDHVRHANKYSVLTSAAAQESVHMILKGPHLSRREENHLSSA